MATPVFCSRSSNELHDCLHNAPGADVEHIHEDLSRSATGHLANSQLALDYMDGGIGESRRDRFTKTTCKDKRIGK